MASSSSGARSWRTAFLTLRDEALASPPPTSLLAFLRDLILSHSHSHDSLVAAAVELPPREVTSDLMLLAELATAASECSDAADAILRICHLIHDVSCRVHLQINSSSWIIMLNFLEKVVECSLSDTNIRSFHLWSTDRMKATPETLEILRLFHKAYGGNSSLSENDQFTRLLLSLVSCLHAELLTFYRSSDSHRPADIGIRSSKCIMLWEMQTVVFSMLGDAVSRIKSSISANLWQSIVEGLRKVMDFLASKNLLMEDYIMSRYYTALLQCLHLVLSDPKGSLSGHVAGFLATLQMFFMYGLRSRSLLLPTTISCKGSSSPSIKPDFVESGKSEHKPYRPPHLRRRERKMLHSSNAQSTSDSESSKYGLTSSDSDHSDSDGSGNDGDHYRSSKARVAAIMCIQDLCHADPKSLSSLWTMILPDSDVLQPRKYQPNLMTCLLFDPVMKWLNLVSFLENNDAIAQVAKVRLASASTLASMLVGHSLTFLQVAEFKESSKLGSFTTLSSSLGQILLQLHRGILFMIQHETHSGLLPSLFKVLMLLISATPYARLPGELLPTMIASICTKIMEDLAFRTRDFSLMATALSCLVAVLSKSPPSLHVLKMLEEEISRGVVHSQRELGVVYLLLQFADQGRHPSIRFEALQALKALLHSYPTVATTLWDYISVIVLKLLEVPNSCDSPELDSSLLKGENVKLLGSTSERCIMAAVKVLDECLRAASGFTGTDDLIESRLLDIQLKSDRTITTRISSAPSYNLDVAETSNVYLKDCQSGCKQWCEVIKKHLPLALSHSSSMVRAASVACFAGMTSSVFFSLTGEKQQFIICAAITSALNEEIPSVKSAACRAIGVISCFSKIFCSSRMLNEFIRAVVFNTNDPLASVRVPASWALANICDSLRYSTTNFQYDSSAGQVTDSECIFHLVESALRLTKDGDKIKANAVRALGNLSRFIRFTHYSNSELEGSVGAYESAKDIELCTNNVCNGSSSPKSSSVTRKATLCGDPAWLERMVQAFVSCVTTGNVKVQWNVCHALGNLFINDTLLLHSMPWAPTVYSILLLLIRDSTNYKIRIHAAVALAVPESRLDYGSSFADVVQGLEHVLESLGSDQDTTPLSFKYKDNLEKQLILTTLHVLGLASSKDDQALKDFLVKKASFLEGWIKLLYLSVMESDDQLSTSNCNSGENQPEVSLPYVAKKEMLGRAIKSLIDIYESNNHQTIAQRFERLSRSLS